MTVMEFDAWRAMIEFRLLVSVCVVAGVMCLGRQCWTHHHQLPWRHSQGVNAHELRRLHLILDQLLGLQLALLGGVAIFAFVGLWFSAPGFGFAAVGGTVGYFILDRLRMFTWSSVKETLNLPYRDTQIG